MWLQTSPIEGKPRIAGVLWPTRKLYRSKHFLARYGKRGGVSRSTLT